MFLDKYLARELGCPTGILSSFVLPRLWNMKNVALNEAALDRLRLTDDDVFLEVGFGGGYLLGRAFDLIRLGRVAGVDASPLMVAHCRKKFRFGVESPSIDIRCASAEALPFESETFTKVCSVNSIFFWPDPESGLSEVHRVMADESTLVLVFTSLESIRKRGFARHGLNLFNSDELRRLIENAGFVDVAVEWHVDAQRTFGCATGIKLPPLDVLPEQRRNAYR
jgi:SAM-dependent methyltransferase